MTAAVLFAAAAAVAAPQAPGGAEARVEVASVLVPVVVYDRHRRPVAGLERGDFRLRAGGRPAPIEFFEGGESPLAVAIAIDASASMLGRRFTAARAAAAALIDRLGPRDRAVLLTFDHRARVIAPLTSDRAALLAGLERMGTGGGTALYDGLRLGIRELEREHGRKALVILTDGEDSMSQAGPGAVEREARRSEVVLYTVWLGEQHAGEDARRLADLARDLGGEALFPEDEADLVAGYGRLFDEMRVQYTLGFSPARPPDGRWHRIEVDLVGPELAGLTVRARKGWLAERAAP